MDVLVPPVDDVTEVEVGAWLAEDGSVVEQGQDLVEVTLDKADMVIQAPASGVLRQKARTGELLAPTALLGVIEHS